MTRFTHPLIVLLSTILLLSCGGTNTRTESAPPNLESVNYTLPNGEVIKGYKKHYKNGYYIGEIKNGEPHGKGAFIHNNKTRYSTGPYSNGKMNGLHKTYNTINGIITFSLVKNGKTIQSYSELDALLAAGDFDKAASKRGPRVFLGIQLQDDTPYVKAMKVIKNAPADLAGIMKNDRIVALNDQSLMGKDVSFTLRELIKLKYDKPLDIKIQRNGQTRTIRMVPGIISSKHPSTTPSSQLLWNKVKAANASTVYQQYIDTVVDNRYKAEAKRRLATILKTEEKAFHSIKHQGDEALYRFCQQYPSSKFLANALKDYYQKIEKKNNFIQRYTQLTSRCEHAIKFQPSYYELLDVGPESMTVSKILTLMSNGMSSTLIATKIKTGENEYRDFSIDEIGHLNSFGIKDDIISAMIEATYAKKKSDQIQQRLEKLEAENRQLKAAQSRQKTSAETRNNEEKNMPLECIKLAAALKACDETSGFLSMGCKAVAKSQFDCPIPLN